MQYARSSLFFLAVLLSAALFAAGRWHDHSPAGSSDVLAGEVRDHRGPVAGARVRIQGQSASNLTDARGRFQLAALAASSGRVTAWKQGYFIGGADVDSRPLVVRLTPLPETDNENYEWLAARPDAKHPKNCGNCHGEIYREWTVSAHSRSVNNRHFLNLYDGSDWHGRPGKGWNLLAEHPDGTGVCTACHAPTVAFSDPAYYDLRKATGTTREGVHCDYCHKVADVEPVEFGLTHGRFGFKLLRPEHGQLSFGPLDDVDRRPDTYAAVYRDSRYCAGCHEGIVFGVHVYSTYSEWLTSPARKQGKQCQTCHMAPTGGLMNLAPEHGGIRRDPQSLGNHRFFAGGQAAMLRQCLKIELHGEVAGDGTAVAIKLTARDVGHRVPTGFADRNLVLVVEAFSRVGARLNCQPGTPALPRSAGTSLAGLPGKLFAKQLTDFDGRAAPFWRARPELADNRLLPASADSSSYQFGGKAAHLRLRLLHRRFWQEVADSKAWPDNEIVVLDQTLDFGQARSLKWSTP
jgi:hypothetical protein